MANPHPEPHPENLRPIKKGDPNAKEIQRKGGKAAAAERMRKRTLREWAEMLGELPVRKDDKLKDPKSADTLKEANLTMDGQIIAAMYAKASKGDVRAVNFLAQLKGQFQEEITVHTDPLAALTEDQLDAILGAIEKARRVDE